MKTDLLKRLSELEAKQYRTTGIAGLAPFYADPEAMAVFYPDEPPMPDNDDD